MAEAQDSCVIPVKGPILLLEAASSSTQERKESIKTVAGAGRLAPDFEAFSFADGSTKNIKLSDHRGKWVVLCFYPGDFTFS